MMVAGGLVYTGFQSLFHNFGELNDQRSEVTRDTYQEISERNINKVREIHRNAIHEKARTLLAKDRLSMLRMMEDNAFFDLQKFLVDTFQGDADLILATLFVKDGGNIQAWQFVSNEHPNGLRLPIVYDQAARAWRATDLSGNEVLISDVSISEFIETTALKIDRQQKNLVDNEGERRELPVFDGVIPVAEEGNAGPFGQAYLRYVLSLEGLEQVIREEELLLRQQLANLDEENEQARVLAAEIASRSLNRNFLFLGVSSLFVFILAYFGSFLTSNRIVGPLRRLTAFAEEMARGNYGQQLSITTNDEIEILSNSFQEMSLAIQKRDQELADINKNLEKLVEERTAQLDQEHRKVKGLLNNMQQAVFAVDEELNIVAPMSSFTASVFGENVAGKNLKSVLYRDLNLNGREKALLDTALMVIFGEDDLQWRLMVDQLPKKVSLRVGEGDMILRVSYSPIWDQNELLEKLMLVVEDVTDVERLSKEIEEQKKHTSQKSERLHQISRLDVGATRDFFKNTQQLYEACLSRISDLEKDKGVLEVVLQNLHTIKGNAGMMGLSKLADTVHEVESQVVLLKDELEVIESQTLVKKRIKTLEELLLTVQAAIQEYAVIAKEIFKIENEYEIKNLKELHSLMIRVSQDLESGNWDLIEKELSRLKSIATTLKQEDLFSALNEALTAVPPMEENLADFYQPWEKVVFSAAFNHIHSPIHFPYRRDFGVWVDLILEFFTLTQSLEASDWGKAKELCQSLEAKALKNSVDYFSDLSSRIERALENADGLERELNVITRQGWTQIYLMLLFDAQLGLSKEEKTRLSEALSNISDEVDKTFLTQLDAVSSRRYLLNSLFRAIYRREMTKGASGFLKSLTSGSGVDLRDGLTEELSVKELVDLHLLIKSKQASSSLTAHLANLSERQKAIFSPIYNTFFEKSQSPEKISYLDLMHLVQFLGLFVDDSQTVSKRYSTVEVVESRLNELKEMMRDLASREKANSPTAMQGVLSAVERLLDAPVKPILTKYERMVQELSHKMNKKIRFMITGDELTMNRDRLYVLEDILIHLIRNSIDHGIESPEDRAAAGKDPVGILNIDCREEGRDQEMFITVGDDGRGISAEWVGKKAVEKGVLTVADLEQLSEEEKVRLIFESSFSSADEVSALSGRGVGLCVVKESIEKVGGEVSIKTHLHQGTQFILRV
jgi:chemotaxis protein histidine kinase CheA/HAMP domain-containing protein